MVIVFMGFDGDLERARPIVRAVQVILLAELALSDQALG